jgi:large repetitive protein
VRNFVLTKVVRVVAVAYLILFVNTFASAQITVTTGITANNLVQQLVGVGVTFTNATLTCNSNGSGKFSSTNAALGIDSGIVLTTGRAATSGASIGVNSDATNLASLDRNINSLDTDLFALSGLSSASDFEDLCKLEFDFVPQGDTLRFRYKFASEEYPDYNCTDFNDAFAFFIEGGSQYPTPTNLAIIPGTTIPVAINSINDGTVPALGFSGNCTSMGFGSPFTSLFYNNSFSSSIVYDGMTTLLTATALVSPCTTYHMKFAIVDIIDGFYDSGVFLKAGSFSTNTIKIDGVKKAAGTPALWPFITEGCISDTIVFKRPFPTPLAQPVYFNLAGTATNGTDFTAFPTFINIPANDTMVSLPVTAFADALSEGTETIIVRISATPCSSNFADSITVTIRDYPIYSVTDNDTVCIGQNKLLSATLLAPDTAINFLWKPGNIPSASNLVLPLSSQTYTVTANYPGCSPKDSLVSIFVSGYPTVNAGVDTTICDGTSTTLTGTASTSALFPIVSYLWTPALTLSANNVNNPIASPTANTTYTLTAVNVAGCTGSDVINVNVKPLLTLTATTSAVNCANADGTITITSDAMAGATVFYTRQPGNVTNTSGIFPNLTGGITYTITTSSTNYCNSITTVNLTGTSAMSFSAFSIAQITCNNANDAAINAVAIGGTGAITYQINSNPTQPAGSYTNLAAGPYIITATDALNCTVTSSVQFNNPSAVSFLSTSSANLICNAQAIGTISVLASGGTGSITYSLNSTIANATGLFGGLSANAYTVVASDANNCTTEATFTITEPALVSINSVNATNAVCAPTASGSISIGAFGGTGGLIYSINAGTGFTINATNLFSNLLSQTYTVQVADANGCTATSVVVVGSVALPSLSLVSSVNVSCFGGNNGTIVTSVTGGTASFSYTILPSIVNNANGTFSNASNGTYVVTVSDANLCTSTISVTITQPNDIIFGTTTSTGTNCSAAANGTISTNATGGTGILSYTLLSTAAANTTGNFSSLAAGTYVVEVVDANGCTKNTTIAVTQPGTLTWATVNATNILCNGGTTGTISVGASGGTGTKLYSLNASPPNTPSTWVGLGAGSYAISVSDANNCSINTVVSITEPPILNFINITNTPLSCDPGGDASLTAIGNGGTPSYTFTLSGGNANTTGNWTNLNAGVYIVQIKDANNCNYSLPYNILAPVVPSISNVVVQNTSCVPNNAGSITVQATGSSALQYSIGGTFGSNNNFNGLTAGNYAITVKDALNCTATSNTSVGSLPSPIIDSINTTLETCSPGNDASIIIYANGSSTLQYSNGGLFANNSIFNNLNAASYTIVVKDNNGCTASSTVVVQSAIAPSIANFTTNTITCAGQSNAAISVSISAGTSNNITLDLSGTANQNIVGTNTTFNTLAAGNYTVVATDANGCTTSSSVIFVAPSQIIISNQTTVAPTCFGVADGTATYLASGGTGPKVFSISPTATQSSNGNFSALAANTVYTITATDSNNCSTTTTLSLTQPPLLIAGTATADSATCFGVANGSISISGSTGGTGTYSYSITPSATTNTTGVFNNLANNGYTVTVKDIQNCTATITAIVQSPSAIVLTTPTVNAVTCNGAQNGSISITASGSVPSYTYNLPSVGNNTTGLFTNLNGSNYVLTATDSKGCTTTSNIQVAEPAVLNIANVTIVHASCNSTNTGTANITTSGGNAGATYVLNPGALFNLTGNFTGIAAGSYTVQATDSKGCTTNTSFTITQPGSINIDSIKIIYPTCSNASNSSIAVYASGGAGTKNYILQPSATSNTTGQFLNVLGGTYTVQVIDANGCSNTTAIAISAPTAINITNATTTHVICAGDSTGATSITATGGTGALTYVLSVIGQSNNSGIFNNIPANNYVVTVTDINNCSSSTNITITENIQLTASNIVAANPRCAQGLDGFITLEGAGGVPGYSFNFNFIRDTALGNFQNLGLGTYTITITDNVGCNFITAITLNTPQNLVVTAPNITPTTCFGQNAGTVTAVAQFGNPGGYVFTCQPGIQTNTTGTFTNLGVGVYTIVAKDYKGCNGSTIVQIVPNTLPIVLNFNVTPPTCNSTFGKDGIVAPTALNAKPPYMYYWPHIQDSMLVLTNVGSGTYTVLLKDSNGCVATDTVSVPIPACCTMIVPNAFTPNGDGTNDNLRPVGPAEIEVLNFDVFDRWGNRVYSNTSNKPLWDGTKQGSNLEMDTYFYIFRYKCIFDDQLYELKGDVILMR